MERVDGWPEHAVDVMARSWLGHQPLTDIGVRTRADRASSPRL